MSIPQNTYNNVIMIVFTKILIKSEDNTGDFMERLILKKQVGKTWIYGASR